jgi:hypothetical protein
MSDRILNNTIMRLKASSLKGPQITQGKLSTIAITHIRHIEQKIKEADSNNKTFINYKIESDFADVQGMTNSEVQTFVYSKIIEDLTTCDYDVYFRNIVDDYTFFVKWNSRMAKLELENRKKILDIASNKYMDKKSQIHAKNSTARHSRKAADDNIKDLSRQIYNNPKRGQLIKPPQGVDLDYVDLQKLLDSVPDGEDWTSHLAPSSS